MTENLAPNPEEPLEPTSSPAPDDSEIFTIADEEPEGGDKPVEPEKPNKVTLFGKEVTPEEAEQHILAKEREAEELRIRLQQGQTPAAPKGTQPTWDEVFEAELDKMGVGIDEATGQRINTREALEMRKRGKQLLESNARIAALAAQGTAQQTLAEETAPQRIYNTYMNDPNSEGFRDKFHVMEFQTLYQQAGWQPEQIFRFFRDRKAENEKAAGVTRLDDKRKAMEPPSSGGAPLRKEKDAYEAGRNEFLRDYLFNG